MNIVRFVGFKFIIKKVLFISKVDYIVLNFLVFIFIIKK